MQRAQYCGLGELAAEFFANLCCRQNPSPLEQAPYLSNQRRDPRSTGKARRMFPVAISAQRVNKRQRLFAHHKIRMVGSRSQQIERNRRIGLDQPDEQLFRRLDSLSAWG
jgi:hypothetical protein